jgi:hypothetical protein
VQATEVRHTPQARHGGCFTKRQSRCAFAAGFRSPSLLRSAPSSKLHSCDGLAVYHEGVYSVRRVSMARHGRRAVSASTMGLSSLNVLRLLSTLASFRQGRSSAVQECACNLPQATTTHLLPACGDSGCTSCAGNPLRQWRSRGRCRHERHECGALLHRPFPHVLVQGATAANLALRHRTVGSNAYMSLYLRKSCVSRCLTCSRAGCFRNWCDTAYGGILIVSKLLFILTLNGA